MIGIRASKGLNQVSEKNNNQPTNPTTKNNLFIVSYGKQKQKTLSKTDVQNPRQPAKTYENINLAMLGDKKTPYRDGKFDDIKEDTKHIFNALRGFENSVFNYHTQYDQNKNNEQWKEFKSERSALSQKNEAIDEKNNLQASPAYTKLSESRKLSNLEKILAGSPLSTKLDPLTGVFRDSKTGLYAELKPFGSKPGNYVLCFGSTGVGRMTMKQTKVDIAQVLNKEKVPTAYEQAVELAHALEVSVKASIKKELEYANDLFVGAATITAEDINKEYNKKFNLSVTGQSMGGGLANYVGMKLGIESACYNPAALGQAAIKDLEKSGCLTVENLNKQKIIRQKGDIVSGEKNQKKIAILANFFSFIKIKRPQHLGRIYTADKADIDATDKPKRGFQSRHFTSSFQPFYDYSNTQATTPSDKSDASSKSSSVNSPSGGE